ncbi:MAG: hypothetical protein DI529_17225 [Chryseobacterium sp.]|nr:MAG: hypothetical protein DI529_17225 [Chryseobacterium sp.]
MMINYSNKLILLWLFLFATNVYSQCTGCTVTNPTSNNYTFASGSVVCITTNTTMSDVTFQNNSKICIASGATLIIQNNINSSSGSNVTFEIAGTLQFNQSPNINANLTINISNGGTLRAGTSGGNNFTFNGTTNTLTNYGTVAVSVLGFSNGSSTTLVDNYNLFTIGQNINISGVTTFRNLGTINIGQSYNNNSTSTYLNCGTINSAVGYNLGGGKIINTGNFNVGTGSIDMSGNSRLENYGNFYSKGTINGSSNSVIYNEGLMKITTWQPNGGTMNGPASSSKKGYSYFLNSVNPNGAKVGPNLDLTRYSQYEPTMTKNGNQGQSAIFNSAPVYVNSSGTATTMVLATVTYDCAASGNCTAPQVISINICPNADGTFPPVANDDTYSINAGSSSATSILANDLEQYNGAAATTSNVTITQISTSNADVNINTSTGLVQVGSGVTSGTYTISYRICRISSPNSCSTATVTVNVTGITSSVCYKPAVTSGNALSTNAGITSLSRADSGGSAWPETRKGAWMVLESKTKGFVINRLTTTQVSNMPSANLKEGMMVYNTSLNCLQINTDGTSAGWKCFNTQACPD